MTDEKPERWVPADCETTGLVARDHLLLEIQVFIVEPTAPYEKVEPDGFHAIIQHDPEEAYHRADEYVREMHEKTGLWWKLRYGTPLAQVDADLRAYLEEHLARRQGFLVGNSVRLDQNFIEHHLPLSHDWLHYRAIDVTSIAMWARHEHGIGWMPKEAKHTATDDIEETLAELRWIADRTQAAPPCQQCRWAQGFGAREPIGPHTCGLDTPRG
ncbi:exonuclease [Microbacterium phage FuzzBuster]|uniref:Exonuclease n=1 Tax=Microbacterium phage FuzzBuster TaxID=2590935 RepID=A0A516KV53_9CAUD|nr:exonuclease [Microbacterium phage FuzzBuster]